MPLYSLNDIAPITPAADRFWVAPDAHVMGRVTIGEDVGIWFGTIIRGDTEMITIGARSNIQEMSMLHTDPGFPLTLGIGCTIGHGAILHGCEIGDGGLVGMGATVLNGAKIGRNSIVGANALVTEGKVFEDNTLIVGSPARAVRQLDPAHIAKTLQGVDDYVRKWKLFAQTLRLI